MQTTDLHQLNFRGRNYNIRVLFSLGDEQARTGYACSTGKNWISECLLTFDFCADKAHTSWPLRTWEIKLCSKSSRVEKLELSCGSMHA